LRCFLLKAGDFIDAGKFASSITSKPPHPAIQYVFLQILNAGMCGAMTVLDQVTFRGNSSSGSDSSKPAASTDDISKVF
jgi:hypothetical protein